MIRPFEGAPGTNVGCKSLEVFQIKLVPSHRRPALAEFTDLWEGVSNADQEREKERE